MSAEFQLKKLYDVIELVVDNRGRNPKSYEEFGIPVIDNYLITSVGEVRLSEVKRYIDDETYESFLRTHLQEGDVLMTLVGNGYGKVATAPKEKSAIIQNTIGLRCDGHTDSLYLYYLLRDNREALMNLNRGAAQPSIKVGDVLDLEFQFPSLKKQQRVSKTFRSIDRKIELNRQTNQILEQIAQAVFKSWFVDFEPTRAKIKAIENGQDPTRAAMAAIAGKTLVQLDTLRADQIKSLIATADLFPDALELSDLGEIPKGWGAGKLNDIAQFSTGRVNVLNLSQETYVSTENMLEGKKGITIASSLPAVKTVPSFDAGHILISNIRPYFMKIWFARFQGGRSNDILSLEAKEASGTEYLYNLLYQDKFFDFMMKTSKGAKMPRGDKAAIMGWGCVHPGLDIKEAYSRHVGLFYKFIEVGKKENKSLEQLRDTLLPKLLSGEIDLSEKKGDGEWLI